MKKTILIVASLIWCLITMSPDAYAQTGSENAVELLGDRTFIHVDRLNLKGDETLMDVFLMYPELLVAGFDDMLSNYQLRTENTNIYCDVRQFLTTTPAKSVERIQICENPSVAKGTTGLGGVIDLNMKRCEEGAHGFVGSEFTHKLGWAPLGAVNYGYTSPNSVATTDVYAIANAVDNSRHGDSDFRQNTSINVKQRFSKRDRMIFYLRQSYDRLATSPFSSDTRSYLARGYYFHTFNNIGTELLCVAGYLYDDDKGESEKSSLKNKKRTTSGLQTYMVELNTPLPFLGNAQLMAGWESDFIHLKYDVYQDMVNQSVPFDANDRYTVSNNDLYIQLDYGIGPVTLSLGDRLSLYHYGMKAANGLYSCNPNRNAVMASAITNIARGHQLQLAYYRRYINPSFLDALPTAYPESDGTTWMRVRRLKDERRADVYRLAYIFNRSNLNANLGGKFVHMVDGGENSLHLNASVSWRSDWFTLAGGANFIHANNSGDKTNFGYVRLAPSVCLPWQMRITAQAVWCSKNAPERQLTDTSVYGLLGVEKTFARHLALSAQWHDMFYGKRHGALVSVRYLF